MSVTRHPRLVRSLCGAALGAALTMAPSGSAPTVAILRSASDADHTAGGRTGTRAAAPQPASIRAAAPRPASTWAAAPPASPRAAAPRPASRSAARPPLFGPAASHRGDNRPGGVPSRWAPPVTRSPVSAAYGVAGDWAAGHHTGIDFAVPVGTPVHAIGEGTVLHAGWAGDYGNLVEVRMPDGHHALYAHLSRLFVTPGAAVAPGTVLGASGNTGRSSGPHLHFEIRSGPDYGSDVDPRAYLADRGVRLPD